MIEKTLYLDYMATTPVDPRVAASMNECYGPSGVFANSASQHVYGLAARDLQTRARLSLARLLNSEPNEIIFTSGATEANNIALIGAARFYKHKGNHIVTVATEHRAVLDPIRQLAEEGFEVTVLPVEPDGHLNWATVEAALTDQTILLSVMHVNNEIGVIHDIAALGALARRRGIIFHVDAAQSVGKIPLDVRAMSIDLLSVSAHKFYGPQGIGALFVSHKPRIRLQPILFGGGQEQGLRPGTLPNALIAGLGKASEIAYEEMVAEGERLHAFRTTFLNQLKQLSGWHVNGCLMKRLPGNCHVTLSDVHPDALHLAIEQLAVSNASACMIAKNKPSHVLEALGLSSEEAKCSLRIAFGRFTTQDEVNKAAKTLISAVHHLRDMQP